MSNMFGDSSATSLYNLTALKTSNVTDMFRMFGKSSVTALDLSNFDTSKVTNMSNLFSSCKAATLDVSNFNTSKVTDMMSMFTSASSIVGLDKFDTSNVTNMNQMFENVKVATLDLSNFDTSKVTNMGSMFSGTTSTSIDLSSFDTSNVTNMSNMFYSSQVDKLNLNNFDTSNVTSMHRMFASSNVTSLDLSSFDTSKVTRIVEMFTNSKNLKTIYVSDKFVTNSVTQDTNMFFGYTNLVGENGTKYNSSYVDKTYARIDKSSTPGYFTRKSGFEITVNDLTYPFGTTQEETIYIKNVGNESLQIKSISCNANCEIVGSTQPIVAAGATNTDFKITLNNKNIGSSNGIITIVDGNDRTYTKTISVKVTAQVIPPVDAS